jgi:hypothetical protein
MADDYDEESEARDVLEVGPGKPLPGPKKPPPKPKPAKKGYKSGGYVSKADGCAQRGKTRGTMR